MDMTFKVYHAFIAAKFDTIRKGIIEIPGATVLL